MLKLLLGECPNHNMENIEQMQHFTRGLNVKTQILLDASTRGTIKNKNGY